MSLTGKRTFCASSEAFTQGRFRGMATASTSNSDPVPTYQQRASPLHSLDAFKIATMETATTKDLSICQASDGGQETNSDSTIETAQECHQRTSVIDIWRRRERETLDRQNIIQTTTPPRARKIVKRFSGQQVNENVKTTTRDADEPIGCALTPNPSFVVFGDLGGKQNSNSPVKDSLSNKSAGLQIGEAPFDNGVVAHNKNISPRPIQIGQKSPSLPKTNVNYAAPSVRRNIPDVSPLEIPPSPSKGAGENHEEVATQELLAPSPKTIKKQQAQKRRASIIDVWAQREKAAASPSYITRKSPASVTAIFFDSEAQAINEVATGSRDTYDSHEGTVPPKAMTTTIQEETLQCIESPNRRSLSVLDRWKRGMIHTDDFSSSQENSPSPRTRRNWAKELPKEESPTSAPSKAQAVDSPNRVKAPSLALSSASAEQYCASLPFATNSPNRAISDKRVLADSQVSDEDLPFDEDKPSLSNKKSWINFTEKFPATNRSKDRVSSPTKSEEHDIGYSIQPDHKHKVFAWSPLTRRNLDQKFLSASISSPKSEKTSRMYAPNLVVDQGPTDSSGEPEMFDTNSTVVSETCLGSVAQAEICEEGMLSGFAKKSGSIVDRWTRRAQCKEQTVAPTSRTNSCEKNHKIVGHTEGKTVDLAKGGHVSTQVDGELVRDFNHKLFVSQNQSPVKQLNEASESGFGRFHSSEQLHSTHAKEKKELSMCPDTLCVNRTAAGVIDKSENAWWAAESHMKSYLGSKATTQEEEGSLRLDYSQGSVLSSRSDLSTPPEASPISLFERNDTVGVVFSRQNDELNVHSSPSRVPSFSQHVAPHTYEFHSGSTTVERPTDGRSISTEATKSEAVVSGRITPPKDEKRTLRSPASSLQEETGGVRLAITAFESPQGGEGLARQNIHSRKESHLSKEESKEKKTTPSIAKHADVPHADLAKSTMHKPHGTVTSNRAPLALSQPPKDKEITQKMEVPYKTTSCTNQCQQRSTIPLAMSNERLQGKNQSEMDSEVPRSESRQSYFMKKGKRRALRRRMERNSPSSDRWPSPAQTENGDFDSLNVETSIHDLTDNFSKHVGPSKGSAKFLTHKSNSAALQLGFEPNQPISHEPSSHHASAPESKKPREIGTSEAGQPDTHSFFSHAGSAFSCVTSPTNLNCRVPKDQVVLMDGRAEEQEPTKAALPSRNSPMSADESSVYLQPSATSPLASTTDSFRKDGTNRLAGRYHTSSRFLDANVQESGSFAADNSTVSSAQNSSHGNSTCSSGSSRYSYESGASESGVDTAIEETYRRRRHRRRQGSSKSERVFQEELTHAFQNAYHSFGIKKLSEDVSESVKALDLQQLKSNLNEGMHVASESLGRFPEDDKRGDAPSYEGIAIEVEYVSDSEDDSQADILCSVNTGGEFEHDDSLTQVSSFRSGVFSQSDIFSLGETTNGGSTAANSLVFLGQVRLSTMQS